ncbi:MAG: cupin domain-containing protein [Pseudomonadota bacterium]
MTVIKKGTAEVRTGDADDPLGAYRAERISDTGGLTQFGAFIEELPPGSSSSISHWHTNEDEMVFLLEGTLTLTENEETTVLTQGDSACWPAGEAVAHSLHNHADQPARYMVIGTRAPQDTVTYPDRDRVLHHDRTKNTRRYTTLDGRPTTKP